MADSRDLQKVMNLGAAATSLATSAALNASSMTATATAPQGRGYLGSLSRPRPEGKIKFVVNCFPSDTLVATSSGLRSIAHIEANQLVWAFNFNTGDWTLCPVECRHDAIYDGPLVTIDLGDSKVARPHTIHSG